MWWLVIPGSAVALGLTALNLLTWPRGRVGDHTPMKVSVLIPARNEQDTIEACVRAAAAQR